MKLSQRLAALLENPHLKTNRRDYDFACSLQQAYQRQGRLTPGRRPWLDKLEEKYSEEAVAQRASLVKPDIVERLKGILSRTEKSSWAQGFIESVLSQAERGYTLSPNQMSHVDKIDEENSGNALIERQSFAARYRDVSTGLRERALLVAKYYCNTSYFRNISSSIINYEDYVPTLSQYNKLVENKYAKKVLAGYYSEPKYPTGSLIEFRKNGPHIYRGRRGMVMQTNFTTPCNACVGNKVYQVLPLGATSPVTIEERYLKKWRAADKK